MIFVSERAGRNAAKIFDVLDGDVKSYAKQRRTFHVNYELLNSGDQDETRFVLGKIIFDTLYSKLACQENQNASLHPSSAELSSPRIQNVIGTKTMQLPLPACPENSVDVTEDQLIRQQNQNAIAMEKMEDAGGIMKGELIYQQNQNAIAMEKRQPPLPTCPENTVYLIKGEQIRQKNQSAIAKKRHPSMNGELDGQ